MMFAVVLFLAANVLFRCPVLASSQGFPVASVGQVVMGTVLEVTVIASTAEHARTLATEAITIARHWDEVLSPFLKHSELTHIQKHQGQAVYISEDLRWALRWAAELARATRGTFEPGYRSTVTSATGANDGAPLFSTLLLWKHGGVVVRPGTYIDPGAFGKGIAVDAIVDWTLAQGAKEVFVNFGGSSFARAALEQTAHPPRRLLLPDHEGRPVGIVELSSGSLSVSESGTRADATPITDPSTGAPIRLSRTAAVWAAEATAADAWSTALVVLGRDGLSLAREHGVEATVIDDQGVATTDRFPWYSPPQPKKQTPMTAAKELHLWSCACAPD